MERFKLWLFWWLSPWYVSKIKEETDMLPHMYTCHSLGGPYKCNCAKSRLARLLGEMSRPERK